MSIEVIDPISAAGIASSAMARVLSSTALATTQATSAGKLAATALAAQTAITALLQAFGVDHRWTGTVLQLRLPDGTYGAPTDLQGPIGPPGETPTLRIGSVNSGIAPAVAVNVNDPLNPIFDFILQPGTNGSNGWTPTIAIVSNGERRVAQIVGWTGGTGTTPPLGFIGLSGLTADITAAIDLRGSPGATGVSGANFMAASTTSLQIALGPVAVVLTNTTAVGFAACQYMALVSQADPRNAMAGLLQSYNPTTQTLTLSILQSSGSGTHADWIVTPSQVLTIPTFVDDGLFDGPQASASAMTVSYVAVSPSASADDDGTY